MTVLFVRSRAGRFVAWLMLGLVGAAGAVLYAWALLKIPDRMHLHDPQDRYNARILVISVGGAVVVGLGLLYTARTYSLSHRGQITDRFTKALEQLDADQLYVRVGGIQALGRLMHDSPIHHDDIIEVLTAFVRDRAPMTPSAPPPDRVTRPAVLHEHVVDLHVQCRHEGVQGSVHEGLSVGLATPILDTLASSVT